MRSLKDRLGIKERWQALEFWRCDKDLHHSWWWRTGNPHQWGIFCSWIKYFAILNSQLSTLWNLDKASNWIYSLGIWNFTVDKAKWNSFIFKIDCPSLKLSTTSNNSGVSNSNVILFFYKIWTDYCDRTTFQSCIVVIKKRIGNGNIRSVLNVYYSTVLSITI